MFALEEIGFERLQLQLGARIESNRYEPKAAVLRLALHHDGEEEGEDEPEPVTLPGRNFTGGSPATPRPAPSLLSNSAAGEFVFHVFGSIAHFERRLISERTRDGIAAARKRGRTPGRLPLDPDRFDNVKRAHPDRVKRTHPPG